MEKTLWNYRIFPRVLKQNVVQTIEIEGLDDSYRFGDDVEYQVKIVARDGYSFKNKFSMPPKDWDNSDVFCVKSSNNILKFTYTFAQEGLWYIRILCLEKKHYTPLRQHYWPEENNESELLFSVYVLSNDLYGILPYKGDLHLHTYGSDGSESPALMAAKYRKYGFDFISITDHYTIAPSLETIEKFKEIPTLFKLFPGEEVHHPKGGLYMFHMVNFNPKKSVNALLQNDLINIEREIEVRAEALRTETVDHADAIFTAWHEWIYEQIKAVDGIAIYPHPYWEVLNVYNERESATREVYKRGLCDIIEMFGGTDKINNRMQAQLYYQMREEGYKYPIVASSDAHSSVWDDRFSRLWTIVFAPYLDAIPSSLKDGKTVAVEALGGDETVYGDLRFVKFAWFLINEYYPRHDELCNSAGQAIERYILGDKTQKLLIELTEKEIYKYEQSFFGYTKIEDKNI